MKNIYFDLISKKILSVITWSIFCVCENAEHHRRKHGSTSYSLHGDQEIQKRAWTQDR